MTEAYKKLQFLRVLNLDGLKPLTRSPAILEEKINAPSNQYSSLLEKNNNVVTGYENFCIQHRDKILYPFVDFVFVGKNIVCQKCFHKFVSKLSYKLHIGTYVCAKNYLGPNEVYRKYKERTCKHFKKKRYSNICNKNFLFDSNTDFKDPKILNCFQTRNKCYSNAVYQRNNVTEKQKISSINNDEPTVKKGRGRPKKDVEISCEPKKLGRPKKLISMTAYSASETDNGFNNNLISHETELNEPSNVDKYNVNLDENKILTAIVNSRVDSVSNKFWSILHSLPLFNGQYNGEKSDVNLTLKILKELRPSFEFLEREFTILYEQLKKHKVVQNKCFPSQEKVQSIFFKMKQMFEKFDQYTATIDMNNEPKTDKEKENALLILKKIVDEMERSEENLLNNDYKDTTSITSMDSCNL